MTDRVGEGARREGLPAAREERARGPAGPELGELPYRYEDDEISLVDLWLVLARHRFILISTVLACVLAGLLFAFVPPRTYAFKTTIEIGESGLSPVTGMTRDDKLLQSAETVVAKLNEGYIPRVLTEYINEAEDRTPPEIQATSPKQSLLVLIESEAPEKDSELHLTLHKKILAVLLEDHGILIGNHRKSSEVQLTQEQKKYESHLDEGLVLVNRLKRLDNTKTLLEKQIGEIQDLLSNTASGLERALSQVGDENKALMFLMVGNEIQQNRTRLAALEERLHIGLPRERDALAKQLADVERAKITQQEKISEVENRLRSIRDTRAIVAPARSMKPIGPGRAAVLALAGVLGLILGIFAAFFAEFLAKARAAMAEEETTAAREPVVYGE